MRMPDLRRGAAFLPAEMRICEEKKPVALIFRAVPSASSLSKYAWRAAEICAAPVGGFA